MTESIEISSYFHKDEDIELVHRSSSFESGMSPFGIDHPTNILVKNIITRNFYLLPNDLDTAAIFQPLRILYAYRRDNNLRDSLVRSTLNGTTATNEDRNTLPCALLHATPACTPTHRPLLIPPDDALRSNLSIPVSAKTWFMPSNAVPVTRYISAKLVDAWGTDLGSIYDTAFTTQANRHTG